MPRKTALAKIKSLSPDKETNRVIDTVQENVHQAIKPMLTNPMTYGVLLKSVSLSSSGTNQVNHTLGEPLTGWIVVRQRASATIWDTQDSNAMPEKTLLLQTSANVVVDLYVF